VIRTLRRINHAIEDAVIWWALGLPVEFRDFVPSRGRRERVKARRERWRTHRDTRPRS